ncbi:cellulase family glycosylhydrolase [Lentzea flava]|uniref:Endoglycosylceramidase n=1 Tax=Lentzea flava TaxID=103732 RepID=A0ABQ2UJ38_9PSEU|nr:cellulase family glycosylhydrolase [Lentzea flava]MCP2198903.1 Cellulase (glycosyl hydrolase family 5) [Lentzea flava]GGU32987.1 endoglycosylceramidase [Lentzea flava]
MRRAVLLTVLFLLSFVITPVRAESFDGSELRVSGGVFRDEHGREVVLRGFNVSGTAKLAEYRGLPFANVADARKSAVAMKQLTGANAVRFLLTWAWIEPQRGQIDDAYLDGVTAQLRAFTDQGIRVYLDFHQDLYSRYLFNSGSWYTGDGAPAWAASGYPKESCGLCFHWGQNMKNNNAVTAATYDFWHNRNGVQDSFLNAAAEALKHVKNALPANEFKLVVGVDPLNEPYAGKYDSGQTSQQWERDLLMPFYQRFRTKMDDAGWASKPAFVEPLVFWNQNVDFFAEPGGLALVQALGERFVFNAHFYDGKAQSGLLMPGKAADGQYTQAFRTIRDRATALGTTSIVSEFGHPVAGNTSDKLSSVLKGIYQGLDSTSQGSRWWSAPRGSAISGSQWHWDINYGRHHELMNDNPNKVMTDGDAMNEEHFSAVKLDASGTPVLTVDRALVDRVYPQAVAGTTLAFAYEDRAYQTWQQIPLAAVRTLVGNAPFAVIVWDADGGTAPTELHLPESLRSPLVVSSASATVNGDRLLLRSGAGRQFALVTAASGGNVAAAEAELRNWYVSW